MTQILDNLLGQQMIDLEFYVNAMPSSSGFPKGKMIQYLQQLKERQQQDAMAQQQMQAQQQAMAEQQMQGVPAEQPTEQQAVDEMLAQNTPDVDELLASLTEEERQQAMQNPKYLEQIIAQKMGI